MDKGIIEFLIRAKKATYAGKGKEDEPSRPSSHDLHYSEGELKYIDSYLGGKKFSGEEALWKSGKPFWAMNYAGRVLSEKFSGDFLKEALLAVPYGHPFRGPESYSKGRFTYKCNVSGDFEWFSGHEGIYFDANKIYELNFHGGAVE